MNFLHSFWTTTTNILALKGGFPDAKFHLMSWALSSLQVRKFYGNLVLYTDSFGKELLVERLGLPYTAVHLDLEGLDFGLPKQLWTPKKMYAYKLQNEPFLHIDGDVFIWQPFEESLFSAPLVAQNLDVNMDFYKEVLQTVLTDFPYIPDYIDRDLGKDLIAANAGVIGGTNYLFFKEYVEEAYQFLERNRGHLEKVNLDYLSTFTEQYLFYAFAQYKQVKIAQVVKENASPAYFPELFRFTDLPNRCTYIHLMNGKKYPTFCENLAQRLYLDYPEMHQKVLDTIKDLTPKTAITVEKVIKNEDLFYRTKFVLESWLGLGIAQENDELLIDFIDRIDALIEELPENTAKNIIQEVAGFEFEKRDFIANLPPNEILEVYFRTESIKVNQTLTLPIGILLEKEICISPYTKFVETAWNWAETNEFAMQKHGFDYLGNLNKESAYYKVVLILCVEQSMVIEMLLDVVNIMLFETTSEKQKVKNVIYQVISQVKTYLPDKTDEELSNILISKISYFLYHHILRLV